MRRLAVVLVFAFLSTSLSFAQGGPETDILIDALYTKDVKGILAHLPSELAKLYAELSPNEKLQLAAQLPIVNIVAREGIQVIRGGGSGPVLTVTNAPGKNQEHPFRLEIFVDKRLTDGTETLLRLRGEIDDAHTDHQTETANLLLRYVDDEWRLYEIQADRERIKLDDPNLFAGFRHGRGAAKEASAVGSLRTLNTALITYSATYPTEGWPHSIEQLGLADDQCSAPSANHACLIDKSLSTPPFEKNGYRFTYHAGKDTYTITARPISYGDETKRSFFTDESAVIRVTTEDREPTAEDPPLN